MSKKRVAIPKSLVNTFVKVWNEENSKRKVCEWYINSGWCYQFAVVMKRALDVKVDIYTDFDGGHCWVKIGDYFYDSDHLNGVKRPLTMSDDGKNWRGPVMVKTVHKVWYGGNSGPLQLRTIDKVIREWKQLYKEDK
jgi:hypothetical protein